MKRLTRPVLLMALALTAALLLCSCSASGGKDAGGDTTGPAQTDNQTDTQTVQGTVNQIDTEQKYLVLVTDDDYCRFDFSQSEADVSGLEPGDSVFVTYTGDLDPESEDVTAQLTRIERAD